MLEQPVLGPHDVVSTDFTGSHFDQAQGQLLAGKDLRQRVEQVARGFRLGVLAVRRLVVGDHTDMRKPVARVRAGALVVDEQVAETQHTAAGVVVDDGHMAGAGGMRAEQLVKQPVRPGRFGPAVEDALRIDVLATVHRLAHDVVPVALQEFRNRGVVSRQRRLGPFGRVDMRANGLVIRVLRMRQGVVDEVAIEVDVVFVDAPAPGKTMRVDRVDQQHRRVPGLGALEPAPRQPGHVATRSGITLDAVCSRHQHQQFAGILGADPRHVGNTWLAVWSAGRIGMARQQPRPAMIDRGKEFGARLRVTFGKIIGGAIHGVSWESGRWSHRRRAGPVCM